MTKVDIKKLDYTVEDKNGFKTERIHIIARKDNGERVHVYNEEVDSYFYVPSDQVDANLKTSDMVLELEDGFESIRGDPLTRVYTYIPKHVPQLREDYDHYEADILFPNRFSLDTDIYGGMDIPEKHANNIPSEVSLSEIEQADYNTESRVMYCDIEVDDSDGFPDEEDADKEIVCLTYYDTFEQTYQVYLYRDDEPDVDVETEFIEDYNINVYGSEVDMLEAFANKLNELEPDVITGWNFKKFDAMYLISRYNQLSGLNADMLSPLGTAFNDGWYGGKIKGMAVFDQLKGYKNLQFTELDSFSLEDVAEEELEVGKLNEEDEKIAYMWENDINKLLEYNIRDVYLTVKLEETQGIVQFYEEVANFVGGRLSEVVDYSKAADMYVLRVVNDMFAVPSMDTVSSNNDGEEFEGAEVFDAVTEILEMVSVLDLKSLYPMSMKTINAGPTTKDPNGEITAPNGVNFTKEKESVISGIIDNLLEEREIKKEERNKYSPGSNEYVKYDLQQRAVKVIMNTLYGILGWDRFRLYDEDVAASVTAVGREVIKFTQQEVNEMGSEVIYGDTDSVMLEFDDADTASEVIERSFEIEEHINERYDDFAEEVLNVDEHFFEIEFEKIYRVFIQAGKKKRYAGHIIWKEGKHTDDIDVVGFEVQRSDYSKAAKELLEDLIESILMGADKNEISEMVRNRVNGIKNLEFELDEIGIPGGIGQAFDKYENKTKVVRAAEYANEYFGEEIQPGDKPKGIYVDKIVWDKTQPPQMSDSAYICWMNSSNVPDEVVFDWDKYLDVQIKGPLSRVMECTEYSWDEIISGQDQAGVAEFESNSDADDEFGELNIDDHKSDDVKVSKVTDETKTESKSNNKEQTESVSMGQFDVSEAEADEVAGLADDLDIKSNEASEEAGETSLNEFDDNDNEGIEIMSKDEIVNAADSGIDQEQKTMFSEDE